MNLLPVAVVLPICAGIAAPLVARLHRRLPLVVGLATLLATLAVLGVVAAPVYGGTVGVHFFGGERPHGGSVLGIVFVADPLGVTFALATAAIGAVLMLSLLSELGDLGAHELGGLACLVELLVAALIGSALTADVVNLFVWFEVAALASYGLTGFFLERPIALEAAFKNLVLTSTAGFLVFAGAAMLYSQTGALNLGQLHAAHIGRAGTVALGLLVAGFATKAGLVPFHTWLPDAHTPVPGAVSALFSALMVNLGVVALARIGLQVFPDVPHLLVLLTTLGCVSAVAGAALALVQDDLKRLLAWDTVSQTGILVVGFASRTAHGVAGAVFHLVNHGLFKALLFLCAGTVVHSTGLTHLSQLGGLWRVRPFTTIAFVVACLAIAGIPPLNGYASLGLIHHGLEEHPVVLAVALLAQALTIAALGRAAWLGFLRPRDEAYEHVEPTRGGMRASFAVLALGCVASGVLAPQLVRDMAGPAAAELLHPSAYAHAALGGNRSVPASSVTFDYLEPKTLLTLGLELLVGAVLLVLALRGRIRFSLLRRMHTGSVNDYATLSAVGVLVCSYVLLVS